MLDGLDGLKTYLAYGAMFIAGGLYGLGILEGETAFTLIAMIQGAAGMAQRAGTKKAQRASERVVDTILRRDE